MATAQKKPRSSASGASRSGGTKKKSGSSGRSAANKAAARPIRREVGGGVCLLLSLCTLVSYFQSDGALLRILPDFLTGMVGFGGYFMAPALAAAGLVLLLHRGRPVAARTACALLIPVQAGAVHHLLACKIVFEEGILSALWKSGQELQSGGALAGGLAHGVSAVLGKVPSVLLFIAVLAVFVVAVAYRPVRWFQDLWADRELYEEEEEEELPRRTVSRSPAAKTAVPVKTSRAPVIDIPLDGEEAAAPAVKRPGLLQGFFRQRSTDQRTPDQVLTGRREMVPVEDVDIQSPFVEEAAPQRRSAPRSEGIPAPRVVSQSAAALRTEPVAPAAPAAPMPPEPPVKPLSPMPPAPPAVPPAPPADPPVPPPPAGKKAREQAELAQAAQEVSAQIESQLAQSEGDYHYPPLDLLSRSGGSNPIEAGAELRANAVRLANTLTSFGVIAQAGDVIRGPSVTRYEFTLDQGVKLSKVTNLADDIALALGVGGVRIAPVSGKISVVGVEVPNRTVTQVLIRDVLESRAFTASRSSVAFAVGRDIANSDIVGDIGELPHVLIAGTTGSGKSVCTNSLIISLLYKSSPEDVRFIMVDPKMVELAPYNGIPHLLIPVVTDPKKAAGALQWAVFEMMKRYRTFSEQGVKKLSEYNALAAQKEELAHMASVVVVIDELADLMLVAAKEVEESICRVAQMGRAAGIHLVIATQRPSSDVITGLMKANIPSRIAFAVASGLESRIILDNTGAEKLVGRGDMLYAPLGKGKPQRVQGCYISPEEIERVVSFVKQESGEAQYSDEVMQKIEEAMAAQEKGKSSGGAKAGGEEPGGGDEADELLGAAVDVVLETGMASVSMLQRRLKLGYSRAARLVDQMEDRGIVGPFEGSKPRQVLITKERWQESQMAATLRANGPAGGEDPVLSGEPIDPDDPPWID